MTDKTMLTILQMNDSQATDPPSGGYARIAAIAKRIRAETRGRLLFFDCGDTFQGMLAARQTQENASIPVLNALGLDATAGSRDFTCSPEIYRQRSSGLNYPTLAINMYDKATLKRFFPPYCVKTIGEVRIGLVGIASNGMDKTRSFSFGKGINFTPGTAELPSIINYLRTREKADLVVLISGLGFPQDLKLVAGVPGIDVCLSGHTDNRRHAPVVAGRTLILQSGSHGSFLGRHDLEIEGGCVRDYRQRFIDVEAGLETDPEAA